MGAVNWTEFWSSRFYEYHPIWRKNAEFFFAATAPFLGYNEDDVVLDYGCGLGYLAEKLCYRVKEIHCADISEHFLSISKRRLEKHKNLLFHKIGQEDYLNMSFLGKAKFSKIICLSVIQYYRNYDEVEALISRLSQYVCKKGSLIIADIPNEGNTRTELYGMIRFGLRERCVVDMCKHIIHMLVSDYRKINRQEGILKFSSEKLKHMLARIGLDGKIIMDKLTINDKRLHLIIWL
jgi:2-polyprenyl-3-methyl-5-hydroxy-6-metoxy-1,4-benzoquinol methylase